MRHLAWNRGSFFLLFCQNLDSREAEAASVAIVNSTFLANKAGDVLALGSQVDTTSGAGGACALRGAGVDCLIKGTEFIANRAAEGGALHWVDGRDLSLHANFSDNAAVLGGGCYLRLNSKGEGFCTRGLAGMSKSSCLPRSPVLHRCWQMLGTLLGTAISLHQFHF